MRELLCEREGVESVGILQGWHMIVGKLACADTSNYAQNYDHPVHLGTTRRYYGEPPKWPKVYSLQATYSDSE